MKKSVYHAFVLGFVLLSAFTHCGGSSSGNNNGGASLDCAATAQAGQVLVCGTFDGTTLSVGSARSVADGAVDAVYACSGPDDCVEGEISGDTFNFNLETDDEYLVFFMDGPNVQGIYATDPGSDLTILPTPEAEDEVDLGTVSVDNDGTATGTTSAADLFNVLGLDDILAQVLGAMDNAFLRFSSVDVDGNGVIDFEEDKEYNLYVDFEFDSGSSFEAIQTAQNDLTDASLNGYMYYFMIRPDNTDVDFDTATIAPPQTITTTNPEGDHQCYNVSDVSGRVLNFYCGGQATSPTTPPAGTYTITADLVAGGTQTFTFDNVESQTIADDLEGIYLPQVQLTMNGDQVASVDWQWYKKTSGVWTAVTDDAEIAAVMSSISYEIDDNVSGDVLVQMEATASGSSVPDTQAFTPTTFRISYMDIAGFCYGIEWR